jgi:hypothetical protein
MLILYALKDEFAPCRQTLRPLFSRTARQQSPGKSRFSASPLAIDRHQSLTIDPYIALTIYPVTPNYQFATARRVGHN